MTLLTVDEFLNKYQNKSWDFDNGYPKNNPFQCFDLFQFYNRDVVGGQFVPGNGAKDIWTTYPKDLYERIPNGPTNYPIKGDCVIWGTAYGPYGHVAICSEDGNPQTDSFTVLSQNDPAGVPSIYKTYSDWKGVLGWLRPKPKQESALDVCNRLHTQAVTELEALKKEHEKCSLNAIEISSLRAQVLTLTTERNEAIGSSQAKDKMINDLRTRIDKAIIALQQ